ncbi:putative exonuclease GOR [Leptinotarsa decemlineata]|uniref:putative exonuclease GOR n=1 Tax=Leptinotarsa decemlineata TaxID=7539 RepID=UPI003D3046A7
MTHECCRRPPGSIGCTESRLHVWKGTTETYDDYVFTTPSRNPRLYGTYGVYALDCEMCYTVKGLEVTRVTIVDSNGRCVYESFVKPLHEIVDYNTLFSGITAEDIIRGPTNSLAEVQRDLMSFISADTILIGHGLENDLRALKIVHYKIVDTAFTFPHYRGLPFRRSLKDLISEILRDDIQCSSKGHDSREDATACMRLMLWRVRIEFPGYL